MLYAIETQQTIYERIAANISIVSPQGISLTAKGPTPTQVTSSSPLRATLLRTKILANKPTINVTSGQSVTLSTSVLVGARKNIAISSPQALTIPRAISRTIRPTTAQLVTQTRGVAWDTAFNATLATSGAATANISYRQYVTPLAFGGGKVRVYLRSGTTVGWTTDHVSIGVVSSAYNTTATPVELLFNGGAGFNIGINTTVVSDWTIFVTTGAPLVVVIDNAATASMTFSTTTTGVAGCVLFSLAATDSYNVASPGGTWTTANNTSAVARIEVRP